MGGDIYSKENYVRFKHSLLEGLDPQDVKDALKQSMYERDIQLLQRRVQKKQDYITYERKMLKLRAQFGDDES